MKTEQIIYTNQPVKGRREGNNDDIQQWQFLHGKNATMPMTTTIITMTMTTIMTTLPSSIAANHYSETGTFYRCTIKEIRLT